MIGGAITGQAVVAVAGAGLCAGLALWYRLSR
jgi:hypothetical protein